MHTSHTVVIASGNKGKLREFAQLFSGSHCKVQAQSDFDVPEAEETGLSFIENAILKARNAALHTGSAALADDSGLAVDYLDGAPGIYSARYSADEVATADDNSNNAKLLRALQGVPAEQRGASFICALAYIAHANDPVPVVCTGEWRGQILEAPEGDAGFGYDPLFYLPALECSSASLSPAIKNAHSHRGIAVQAMQAELARRGVLR